MYHRIEKCILKYFEDGLLDLIDLTVSKTDMVILKKPGILQEIKKLYDAVLLYENDIDVEHAYFSLVSLNMMTTMCYQKIVILVKFLVLEISNMFILMNRILFFQI